MEKFRKLSKGKLPEAARVMYDALLEIAQSEAFFDREKRMVKMAQEAINKVNDLRRNE
jgi:hypothetical protein